MFCTALSFNRPFGAWDIRRAEDLSSMFAGHPMSASSFNQPLGAWADHIRPGADTTGMFSNATAFDRAANAPWYTWTSRCLYGLGPACTHLVCVAKPIYYYSSI